MNFHLKSINPIYPLIFFFFLFKLNHLFVPYFWDELGVYSRAALYMFDHQISLMPDALPVELSRGHPLLCAAIFGVGYKILGPSVWAGHLTALLFSCALLYLLHRFSEKFFDHQTAILASVLLAIQPVFIAQSTMVLPEVMLAFFCTCALYAYVSGRFLQLALFSTLAILIKETAVAIPCCLGIIELGKGIHRGFSSKDIGKFCCISTPVAAWGLFLLVQKMQNGWFFFPLHTGYISFSFASVSSRLGYYLSFMLKGQGRYVWSVLILFSFVLFLWRNRERLLSGKFMNKLARNKKWQIALVLLFYIIIALFVSVLNFHLARYVLLIMPVLCILVAALVVYLIRSVNNRLWKLLFLFSLAVPLFYYTGSVFNVDADMSYLDMVKSQKDVTSYLNTVADDTSRIISDFPVYHGLIDKRSGYSTLDYQNVDGCGGEKNLQRVDFLIFSSPGNLEFCKPDVHRHMLLKKFKSSFANFYLYKNIGKADVN